MKQEPTEVPRERHGRNPAAYGGEDVKEQLPTWHGTALMLTAWRPVSGRYFTKYQFSGLMPSVGLCGVAPLRLSATSVSEYTPFGWNIIGSCLAR